MKGSNLISANKIFSIQKQHGYLMIIAALLIVVIGFLGLAVCYMFVGTSISTNDNLQSDQALYLAEAGLEQAIHTLLTPTLTIRSACSGLSINNTLGAGAYAVSSTGPFAVTSPTTLSGAVTSAVTSIPVASTSSYQSSGRIMIDQEAIFYSSVDSTHFLGVVRGVDGTVASSHVSGTAVGQYQCNFSSQGGAPSLTPASTILGGKRTITESVQLQEGWAVGNNINGSTWEVVHWNSPTEEQWTSVNPSISPPQILNGVSMISNVDVWAVGDKAAALHYNGAWSLLNTGIAGGDNLLSVSAISASEVWAAAAQGKVYKWNGSAWSIPVSPGNTLNGISLVEVSGNGLADGGWVVGTKKTAYHYNGSAWASLNTGVTVDLNGVSTLSTTDAWIVGNSGNIFHWTGGASWSSIASPTTQTLNAISMMISSGSDIGWAVGNSSTAIYYNGTSWASKSTGLAGGLTLNGVVTISANEAWLVDSSGHIYEWNGSTWTLVSTASTSLNAIDMLHPNSQPYGVWAENFS